MNGKAAKSFLQFYREVGNAGRDTKLVVLRGDQRKEIAVRLLPEKAVFGADYLRRRLGLTLERLPADVASRLRLDPARTLWGWPWKKADPPNPRGSSGARSSPPSTASPPPICSAVGRLLNRKRAGDSVRLDLWILRRRGRRRSRSRSAPREAEVAPPDPRGTSHGDTEDTEAEGGKDSRGPTPP